MLSPTVFINPLLPTARQARDFTYRFFAGPILPTAFPNNALTKCVWDSSLIPTAFRETRSRQRGCRWGAILTRGQGGLKIQNAANAYILCEYDRRETVRPPVFINSLLPPAF